MSTPTYDIYFRGEILPGQDEGQVKANIANLFKANEAKLAQLFSGKAIAIKKGVDKTAALKYQQAFKNAGAKAVITAGTAAASPTAPSPEPASQAEAQPTTEVKQPASETRDEGSWDVLPVGSDVLKPSERKVVEDANIDTSAIKVASVFAQPEEKTAPPPAPDTSHISVAETGADMNPDAPTPTPDLELDLSALDLAEAGARMSDEKEQTPEPDLDLSKITTAEPGSDMGQIKKDPPPPAPDTSHLSIKE